MNDYLLVVSWRRDGTEFERRTYICNSFEECVTLYKNIREREQSSRQVTNKKFKRTRRNHLSTSPPRNKSTVTNGMGDQTDKGNAARKATFAEPLESQGIDLDNESISSEDSNETLERPDGALERSTDLSESSDNSSDCSDNSSDCSDKSSKDSEESRDDFDGTREVSSASSGWFGWLHRS